MPRTLCAAAFLLATLSLATPASAQDVNDLSGRALEALSEAAAGVVVDDRARVEDAADRAGTDAAGVRAAIEAVSEQLGRRRARTRRRADKLVARTEAAATLLADSAATRLSLVRAFERAAKEASKLRKLLTKAFDACPALHLRANSVDPVRKKDGSLKISALPGSDAAGGAAVLTLGSVLPAGLDLVPDGIRADGSARSGRFRLKLVGGPGAVRVDADACGSRASLWLVVRGPDAGLVGPLSPLVDLDGVRYDDAAPSFRVGLPASLAAPDTGDESPDSVSIAPTLPSGLEFDGVTGAISGIPTVTLPTTTFTVTATKGTFEHTAQLRIDVAPPLPAGITELEDGFEAQSYVPGAGVPVKLAFTPDGRLLYSELGTGSIRVVTQEGVLLSTPFATLPIATGGERGLLGLAVAPDFATSGHVFAYASTPAGDGHADRNRVVRLTASGDVGEDLTVILDDLPIAAIHNGGGLAFGPDGHLYVSVGDATVEANAQTDGSRAGKVLRIATDGTFPTDNPIPDDPEWCRGLRNPFDIAFHPRTGGLFISENGPTANDELNFGQKGKNFQWGPAPPDLPEFLIGFRIQDWTPVIVPTGITFVSPEAFGAEFADDLFLCSYDHAEVRRIVLSGELLTDLDEEVAFLRFADPEGIANKPLDVAEGPEGWVYVSTFSAIWRVRRWSE